MFFLVALPVAIICHWWIKSYLIACIISVAIAVPVLQVLFYQEMGYLDPFFVIGMLTTGAASFIISLIAGLPFLFSRRKAGNSKLNQR